MYEMTFTIDSLERSRIIQGYFLSYMYSDPNFISFTLFPSPSRDFSISVYNFSPYSCIRPFQSSD